MSSPQLHHAPVLLLLASMVSCGPRAGTADGSGSADDAGQETADDDSDANDHGESEGGSADETAGGSTDAAEDCPQSDLPAPFCHVAQSYGSTLEMDPALVPRVLDAVESPGEPVLLLIDVEEEFRLVEAEDFSAVRGVMERRTSTNAGRFFGDFDGDGVTDVGFFESLAPVEIFSGADLSVLAIGPHPEEPMWPHQLPAGWPAAAIDVDGDGYDEVITVELGSNASVWHVANGALELIDQQPGVLTPCAPIEFPRGDFNADGIQDLAIPTYEPFCTNGANVDPSTYQLTMVTAPLAAALADLPAIHQANGALRTLVGDLDGDGRDDLLLHDHVRLTLIRSEGEVFQPLSSWEYEADLGTNGNSIPAPLAGDFDGNGLLDLAIRGFGDDATRLYWGPLLSDDYFSFPENLEIRYVYDLNGDGRSDFVVDEQVPSAGHELLIYWSQ